MVDPLMSVRKLAAAALTTFATLAATGGAVAQDGARPLMNGLPPVDPFEFKPQFRWFEPVYDVDLEELKPEKRAPNGWFATYDRLNLYGSRPETNFSLFDGGEGKLDSGYGDRYEVGYMLPHEDTGWTFTYTDNEVSEAFLTDVNTSNIFVDDGNVLLVGDFGQVLPRELANNTNFEEKFFREGRSVNVMELRQFELNKTWRLTPYHYGGILEPMVGFRYAKLDDYNFINDVDLSVPLVTIPQFGDGAGDRFTEVLARTDNEMLLAQFGARYFKQRGRFTYVTDWRAFLGENLQCTKTTTDVLEIAYATTPPAPGDSGVFFRRTRTDPVIEDNQEFVIGTDIRATLGYQLTRFLQLRAGGQMIYFGRGVWRGGGATTELSGPSDQSVVMFGGTFGLSLNH